MLINEVKEITVDEFFKLNKEEGGIYQIDTPDGWKDINLLITKQNKDCYLLRLDGGLTLECADSHLVNTKNGWKEVVNLDINKDVVLTKEGFSRIIAIESINNQMCYDFNINSDDNSYYSNDIVSHNSGKSMAAKAVAALYQLPLLRLDFGTLFNQYVGESENRIRSALKIAENLSPAVLWCDEIDKGLSGHKSSGSSDSGVTSRVIGTFLTWMQEKTAPVFIMCTANDQDSLPAPFLRAGRFDEIFFVDLPNRNERCDIVTKLLRRKNRDPSKFNIQDIAGKSDGYTGAELEKAIDLALRIGFHDNKREITTEDVILSIGNFKPLSITRPEAVESIRVWAEGRCIKANTPDTVPGATLGGKRKLEITE